MYYLAGNAKASVIFASPVLHTVKMAKKLQCSTIIPLTQGILLTLTTLFIIIKY